MTTPDIEQLEKECAAMHKPKLKPLPANLPHELFNGNAVLWEARRLFPGRTITGENVSDVLDAVVSLIRKRAPRTAKRGRFPRRAC